MDDDDIWLPEKLSHQLPLLGQHPIVCANAERSDGHPYFRDDNVMLVFDRHDLLKDNPVIISTAVVNRRVLLEAGGFPEVPGLAAVADYGAWLAVADVGGTVARLPAVLVHYETHEQDRLSARAITCQIDTASLAFKRWTRHPSDLGLTIAVARHSVRVAKLWLREIASWFLSRASSRTRS